MLTFRTHLDGFTNHDLRQLTAGLIGLNSAMVTAGQATYDLRRLRSHGLIERRPHSHRYQVTDHGLRTAMLLTRVHDRLLPTALAYQAAPSARTGSKLRPRPTNTPSTPSPNRTDSPPENNT